MRAHVITAGKITNTIEVESLDFMPELVDASSGGKIGDSYADGVFTTPEPLPPTDDEKKKTGIEILGVMCSATKDDQMGLTAVGLDYSMTTAGGGTFSSTKFEFANGNSLVINSDNFATIYNLWVPFRRSFFTPGN